MNPEGPPTTVFLVGMMGAGKSSVGPLLAARLGRVFLDTDRMVEERAGARVAEIFAREGEAGFRARERSAIESAAGQGAIVSLGGGAVSQPGAADAIATRGILVYLRARPETLVQRLDDGEERPLLRGLDAAAPLAADSDATTVNEEWLVHQVAGMLLLSHAARQLNPQAQQTMANVLLTTANALRPLARARTSRRAIPL